MWVSWGNMPIFNWQVFEVDGYTLDLMRKGERFLWWDRSPVSAGNGRASYLPHLVSGVHMHICISPSPYFSLPCAITHPDLSASAKDRLHSDSFYSTRSIYGWHSHRLTDTTAIPTTTTSHSCCSWSRSFCLCT